MAALTSDMRVATARDGARLQYEVLGDGRPVVFLHGGLTSRSAWRRQRGPLAARLRLILRDLRGHDGAPSVAPPDFGFATSEVADMLAVLDAEGLDQVDVVGHSTGGALAFLFARARPERVRRMVLIEPTLPSLLPPGVWQAEYGAMLEALDRIETVGPMAVIGAMIAKLLGENWQAKVSPRTIAKLEAMAGISVAHARAFQTIDVRDDDLRALSVPALLLYGEESMPWERLIAERFRAVRPDLAPRFIAGASHNVHGDQPARVNATIIEFLTA